MRGPLSSGRRRWNPQLQVREVHCLLVCPRLLELDERHGEFEAVHKYPINPKHKHKPSDLDAPANCGCLWDHEAHDVKLGITFQTESGAIDPRVILPTETEWPQCWNCGKPLVHSDLEHLPSATDPNCGHCAIARLSG